MQEFVQNYLDFYRAKECIDLDNDVEITDELLLNIITKYSGNTSKHFLEELFKRPEILVDKLSKLKKYPEILSAVFLDDLYLEKLDSAGFTLLLLGLLAPINKDYVKRYIEVSSDLVESDERLVAIQQLLEVILCQNI